MVLLELSPEAWTPVDALPDPATGEALPAPVVDYHLQLLLTAGFIRLLDVDSPTALSLLAVPVQLTWAGHTCLEDDR